MDVSELQSKFPPECIARIESVIELQQWIVNATDSNIEEVITKIKNSIFIEEKNIYILVDVLLSIVASRYDLNQILVSMITKLYEQEIDQSIKDKIKSKLEKHLFKTQFKSHQLTLFLRRLYDNKFITISSKEDIMSMFDATYLFPEFYPSLHGEESNLKFIGENCFPMGSPMVAVKEDDIDALMELASQPSFNVDTPIKSYNKTYISIVHKSIIHLYEKDNLNLIDVAAMFGSVRCFKYLHILGARKTYMTTNLAVWGGSLEIIRILDSDGMDLQSGIKYAACCFRNDILDWLLETKFVENNQKEITEAFHSAATIGNYYALMKLYNKAIQFEYINGNMNTALQMAIRNNHLFEVEVLISASDYVRDMPKQNAPICRACQVGSLKMVRMLYQNGADVNTVRMANESAIELAIQSKSIKLLKYLFEETDVYPEADMHLFHSAIRTKDLEVIKYFVTTKFFNVNEQTKEGRNALHVAVSTDTPEIVEYIISLGVDPNHKDSDGNTPYLYSVIYNYKKSRDVLENHNEICTKLSSYQIHSMASQLFNRLSRISHRNHDQKMKELCQKLEKKIKKFGGEPAEILIGIELTKGYPNAFIINWLSKMGLKIIKQGFNKLIIGEKSPQFRFKINK